MRSLLGLSCVLALAASASAQLSQITAGDLISPVVQDFESGTPGLIPNNDPVFGP